MAFLPVEKELKETGLKDGSSVDEGLGVSCVLWTVPILSNHCSCLQVLQYNTNTENISFHSPFIQRYASEVEISIQL